MTNGIRITEGDSSIDYTSRRRLVHTVKKPAVQALLEDDTDMPEKEPEANPELEQIQKDMATELAGKGYDAEAIQHELGLMEGATSPGVYDPIDLAVDFVTGGTTFLMRRGIKTVGKVVKEGAKDVALGGVAGSAMMGADFAGAGPIVETMSGLVGPTATQAILSGGRRGMIQFMKNIKKNNPKAHDEIVKAAKTAPDSDISKAIRETPKPDPFVISKKKEANLQRILGFNEQPLVDITQKRAVGRRFLEMDVDEPLPKHAININFNRIASTDDIKKTIQKVSELFKKDINTARRNVVTHEETIKLANQMGVTPEMLISRKRGEVWGTSKTLAARKILVASAERLTALGAVAKGGSNLQKFEFRKQLAVHYAIQSQVSGLVAETARTFNALKITAKSSKQQLDQIDDLLKNLPGKASTEDIADAIVHIGNHRGINKYVKSTMQAKTFDMFIEGWINGLLSGPQTHAVNTLSNSLVAFWQVPERLLASGFSKMRGGKGGVQAGEAIQQLYGVVEGFKDGVKAFGKTIRTGEGWDDLEKIESGAYRAITAENVRHTLVGKHFSKSLGPDTHLGNAVDLFGSAVRMPGKALMAEDAFFKSIGYRMELRARAYRTVMEEGLTDKTIPTAGERMFQILDNPKKYAPDIEAAAIDAARYQTFTKQLGGGGQAIQKFISAHPSTRLIVPFVRTPINIMKFGFERTPLAPLSKNIRATIAAGGPDADLALSRIALGSMVMAGTVAAAAQEHITGGGPSNYDMRRIMRATGWQPYSIKIGGKYYAYNRLEPLGILLGLSADVGEIGGSISELEADELAAAITLSISKNVTSKTWLRGVSELLNVFDQDDRGAMKFVRNFITSTVPAGVRQLERQVDPELRAVNDMIDVYKTNIPWLSKDALPRRNHWGDIIIPEGGLGPDIISPIYTSTKKSSPIDEELIDLDKPISMPRKTQNLHGVNIELTPKQYDRFMESMNQIPLDSTGKTLKASLNELIRDSDYKIADEFDKIDMIQRMITEAKILAKENIINEFDDLQKLIEFGSRR